MSYVKLLVEPKQPTFLGFDEELSSAKVAILGVPFDGGSTWKAGCRWAPTRIREVSQNLETYDPIRGVDAADLSVTDVGDLLEVLTPTMLIEVMTKVVAELKEGRMVFCIGGDHTVTLGSLSGLKRRVSLVFFDAHLDFRDEYPAGEEISHATVLRRLIDWDLIDSAVIAGVRGVSKEEAEALRGVDEVKVLYGEFSVEELKDSISVLTRNVYVTIDIDVLDPSVAPGVSCPEPGGIAYKHLIKAIEAVVEERNVLGIDVVEVNPLLDINDLTSYVAAKLISQTLVAILA